MLKDNAMTANPKEEVSPLATPCFILASASPRRRQLLQEAGVAFTVEPSNTDETVLPGESPGDYAIRVAREKAQAVATHHPNSWVLGADTIVALDGHIFGKPQSTEDGFTMLRSLSGHSHQVMTAFVLLDCSGQVQKSQVVSSRVTFKSLSDEQIREYLATGEPFDKAGAYAVQGLGAALVEQVEGSYTNVVGLPVEEVLAVLRCVGIHPLPTSTSV